MLIDPHVMSQTRQSVIDVQRNQSSWCWMSRPTIRHTKLKESVFSDVGCRNKSAMKFAKLMHWLDLRIHNEINEAAIPFKQGAFLSLE